MKTRIEFTRSPIVPPAPEFSSSEIGACLEFAGIVRELENGNKIPGLFYEAYEPMATALQYAGRLLARLHRRQGRAVGKDSRGTRDKKPV